MDYSVTYEEGFLVREIGSIASKPDIAITELIANAHDAGASEVRVSLPSDKSGVLTVSDNGIGMSAGQFEQRWLRLRYDRKKHQGSFVEIPEGNEIKRKRLAFGRNGVGRHAGLCFNDEYRVETRKDGIKNTYELALSSGMQPIRVVNHTDTTAEGHGTTVSVVVKRNLISFEELSEIISARFLFNPEFKVFINGVLITLSEHPGVVRRAEINPVGNIKLRLTLVDSSVASRNSRQHGVAFWLGGRLLGAPSWAVNGIQILDGRRSFAKRYTIIAESEDLFDYIEADWSGFRSDFASISLICEDISKFVKACYLELSKTELANAKRQVVDKHKNEMSELPSLARRELYEFLDQILTENPDIKLELLELAFKAAINIEKSRAGIPLLYKLTQFKASDISALNEFLEDWCISDAMTILAEIDSRIKVVEAIERLSGDHSVDELHTLHPLIEKARWIFGPEFDTPEYSSNRGLRKTMEIVFKQKYSKAQFSNSAKRPDIVVGENSTISSLALEEFHGEIKKTKRVLLIELKKGGFEIGRDEMDQAKRYVQDIWHAGVDSSRPYIKGYVVGDRIDAFTGTYESVGRNRDETFGEIYAVTYNELVRSAEARLFSLREQIESRYEGIQDDHLLDELLNEPMQNCLNLAVGE